MMTGRVNWRLEATIRIGIQDAAGDLHYFECVLDTGYDGDIALPSIMIERLGLVSLGLRDSALANSDIVPLPIHRGIASWHERLIEVEVMGTRREFVIGMALLENSTLTVQAWDGGEVLIEERV